MYTYFFDFKDISVQFGGVGTVVKSFKAFIFDFVLSSAQRAAALWSSRFSF